MLHSAWLVYIAAPSPEMHSTLRPLAATAAPSASGRPCPIAPPVSIIHSCGRARPVIMKAGRPLETPSSETKLPSGKWRAIEAPMVAAFSAPVGRPGRSSDAGSAEAFAPSASASALRIAALSLSGPPMICVAQPSGTRTLGRPG